MEENLMKASKFGWVDGIMFSYNFRIMHSDKMKKAVNACTEAGIGLIAMKTQASGWMGYTPKITPDENEQESRAKMSAANGDWSTYARSHNRIDLTDYIDS
jgi:aryl-alcohol dehydrogenase-like predicted oxidoreductase